MPRCRIPLMSPILFQRQLLTRSCSGGYGGGSNGYSGGGGYGGGGYGGRDGGDRMSQLGQGLKQQQWGTSGWQCSTQRNANFFSHRS